MLSSYFSFRKETAIFTLISLLVSLFGPFIETTFALTGDAIITISADPAMAGTTTITATFPDPVFDPMLITIDQPGTSDIINELMTDET